MATQKQIAQVLDRAASRSEYPASSKQCWFLSGLIARSVNPEGDYDDWLLSNRPLSSREASSLIDFYLTAEKHAAERTAA